MPDAFSYIFRFCCDPGFNDVPELEALPRFVKEARIDDVMVFANVEEINTGHMQEAEQEIFLKLMREVQELLRPLGVTMSVNHWHTLMHTDLGKHLREGQNFRKMVDPLGNAAELCVCPLDGEWRQYIADVYARYAAIHPEFLWVEDDFRLHNHEPLVWGGCFCGEHMRRYSERAGKPLTREEFVAGVLAPGGVHPYRKIWLDVARETMVETARVIGDVVHAVSPGTRVGLMSSVPAIHAAEGRDWGGVLRGLAAGNPPVNRVHLPTYCETAPGEYQMKFNAVSMQTRAMVPPETELYPELENFPYSRFVKSKRFTRFQLLSALPLNLAGMTIDLYDLNGNGIVWEEGYQDTLCEVKDYLNRLTESGVFRTPAGGVEVLYSPDSSYTLHTRAGRQMEELYPAETFFASLLPAYGIPFRFCADPGLTGKLVAVSGQYFRNLDAAQLRHLFAHNFVLMDGDAAAVLFELGLGELAGIESVEWMPQNGGDFTFEEVSNGREYCGRRRARASAVILSSDAVAVGYAPGAEPMTRLCDSYRSVRAPGLTRFGNAAVFPFGHFAPPPELPPRMFLTSVRQQLFQDLLLHAGGGLDIPPIVLGEPYLNPYYYPTARGFALYLVNAAADACPEVRLAVGSRTVTRVRAVDSETNRERELPFTRNDGVLTLPLAIGGLESALVWVE